MRIFLLLTAALAITVTALPGSRAQAEIRKRDFCAAVEYCRIPARFRSGPYLAKPIVKEVGLRELQRQCGASTHAAGPFASTDALLGCAKFQAGNCLVFVPTEVKAISKEMFAMVLEHELAHCRGWSHDH